MSESSEEDLSPDWLPYSKRKEWSDIVPLEQEDGEHAVVSIAYSSRFREVFDYFRAMVARKEISLRSLELTKDALHLNPANYTVWQYRREILKELNCNLYEELDYIEEVIRTNAKNYQVWHHRRVIVELLNDVSKELELTDLAIEIDSKNYHAWQHRQWAIRSFNLYNNEMMFVDRLIAEDLRNNSAWNQRFFVLKHFTFTPEVIQREAHYAMNRIRVIKNNESAWNFLKGVLKQAEETIDKNLEVVDFCEELYNNGVRSPHFLAFLIDLYKAKWCSSNSEENRIMLSKKIFSLCDDMAKKHDIIRRKYWQYFAKQFKNKNIN